MSGGLRWLCCGVLLGWIKAQRAGLRTARWLGVGAYLLAVAVLLAAAGALASAPLAAVPLASEAALGSGAVKLPPDWLAI